MHSDREPGHRVGNEIECLFLWQFSKQFLLVSHRSRNIEQEVSQQTFVLEIQQWCQGPTAKAKPVAHYHSVDHTNHKGANDAPFERESVKAIVAIARRLLVSVWYILTKREAYHHFDEEGIAYKILIWSQHMDEKALKGLTHQEFVKYCLLRIGVGQDLTRIVRNGLPRRIAPSEDVLALRPELKPPE